jgi:hypothetical protein
MGLLGEARPTPSRNRRSAASRIDSLVAVSQSKVTPVGGMRVLSQQPVAFDPSGSVDWFSKDDDNLTAQPRTNGLRSSGCTEPWARWGRLTI